MLGTWLRAGRRFPKPGGGGDEFFLPTSWLAVMFGWISRGIEEHLVYKG
jgi:hypothetical protein